MAKLSKEQRAYMDGMSHALRIAKEDGCEQLEKELQFRGTVNTPLNVSSKELIECAREYAKSELMFMATAAAMTLQKDLALPLVVIKEYLTAFNNRVQEYRYNQEQYEKDCDKLNKSLGLNEICKEYMEEQNAE